MIVSYYLPILYDIIFYLILRETTILKMFKKKQSAIVVKC